MLLRGMGGVRRFGVGGAGSDLCFRRRTWLLSGGREVDHQGGWCLIWERIVGLMGCETGSRGRGDSNSGLSRHSPDLPHQLSPNKQVFTQPYPREALYLSLEGER